MRSVMAGAMVGVVLTWVLVTIGPLDQSVWAQRNPPQGMGQVDDLLMASSALADGGQQVVLVDTRNRVIGTYHVDGGTGAIALKSVRNIRWDLLMDEFNGGDPKPKEIRALLEQR